MRLTQMALIVFLLLGAMGFSSPKYWIFFTDKGPLSAHACAPQELGISEKSLAIRKKTRPENQLIDATDLPLYSQYLLQLNQMGVRIFVQSRWLNAVSAEFSDSLKGRIQNLPFVRKIQRVGGWKIEKPLALEIPLQKSLHSYQWEYGPSEAQNAMIRVPEVHDLGFSGKGIRIGMLDTGFNRQHRVFSDLDVIAEYDFYDQDTSTANGPNDDPYQDHHGTMTLSVIGGFLQGALIGPAFGASYALAKTEWLPSESRVEEDKWVAGLEWLVDSIGVDIVSSSLGYNTFDNGEGYTYADLDGNTCVTTIAADIAVGKGVVVVNSAGNEGNNKWQYILSPADGDSVLAVGAVTPEGRRAGFSSIGPTFDGRIKPDVVAMGVGVYCASASDPDTYWFVSGTSFSCPLVAGVCTLVLEAHPELPPMEVVRAIKETASQATHPDNALGWGIVNAYEAVFFHGIVVRNLRALNLPFTREYKIDFSILYKRFLNPDSVFLDVSSNEGSVSIQANCTLEAKSIHCRAFLPYDNFSENAVFHIRAKDVMGNWHSAPFSTPYKCYRLGDFLQFEESLISKSSTISVSTNFPNPFNEFTAWEIYSKEDILVEMKILNLLGQEIWRYPSLKLEKGIRYQISWDGNEHWGKRASSGIYFLLVRAGDCSQVIKLVRIH